MAEKDLSIPQRGDSQSPIGRRESPQQENVGDNRGKT